MAGVRGLEPLSERLTAVCSTIELDSQIGLAAIGVLWDAVPNYLGAVDPLVT